MNWLTLGSTSRQAIKKALIALVLTGALTAGAQESTSPVPAQVLRTNHLGELLAGPERGDQFEPWLAGMRAYRQEARAALAQARGDLPDPYAQPELRWARRSFIQPQMMAHDRYFYDPVKRRYTVARYLEDLRQRYGGIDSVLVWPTYPNIGIDNRNQFDLWSDMPGGIGGLRGMVKDFHRHGVRVLFPIMYWDHGTRDGGMPMAQEMAQLCKEAVADGLNGDTMSPVTREFYTESLKARHPLALEPENGLAGELGALAFNILSWGYWWPYQPAPGVDRYKWIEPRHLTHVCDRWAHDRTDMLQYAFFNGDGYESWENVWGIWNQVTPRDAEALRRIAMIYRALPELLASPDYEPYTPALQGGVFATKFPGARATLWTLINRTTNTLAGPQLEIAVRPGMRVFDLWRGTEWPAAAEAGSVKLSFELESRGYGAVLAVDGAPNSPVKKLLTSMKARASIRLAGLSHAWRVLPQRIVEIAPAQPAAQPPEGMVLIPGGKFLFESEAVMIEKSEGAGVQYPWEDKPALKHRRELELEPFYLDRFPVTCAEFKRFLDATHYRPSDIHNFLRDWVMRSIGEFNNDPCPEGWARKPVTWVSLEDARAYARWAGKRLPHEWEWQCAAQGSDGRLYPWGNEKDPQRVPPFEDGRVQRPPTDVDAYPQGASPYGVMDLVGNVWQWTDEYQDEHTRAAVLKGGSYYRPSKSGWYFPQARQLNQHGKYLLLAPSIDRSATIGFRCAMDAP